MKTKKTGTVSIKKSILSKIKNKGKLSTSKVNTSVSLEKAVKNVQQIFKKKNAEATKKAKKNIKKPKPTRVEKHKRAVVYVGHIPHGFYEMEMKSYFKQFGKVTRVRVARSKRTGKSRGYGYVEFLYPEVAKIAAETMNNYLMCNRLLKATYIPPEKGHPGFFWKKNGSNWSEKSYPRLQNRREATLHKNSVASDEDHKKFVQRSLSKLSTLENKLQAKGISIKFNPVDV